MKIKIINATYEDNTPVNATLLNNNHQHDLLYWGNNFTAMLELRQFNKDLTDNDILNMSEEDLASRLVITRSQLNDNIKSITNCNAVVDQ